MENDKRDKIIADLSMKVVLLSVLAVVLIIVSLCLFLYKPEPREKEMLGFCGTVDPAEDRTDAVIDNYNRDFGNGEKLYMQNCAVCHSLGKNRITGPGLANVEKRVPNRNWLLNYISNCDSVYKAGDSYANKLHHDFPDERMPVMAYLSKKDIQNIAAYIGAGAIE